MAQVIQILTKCKQCNGTGLYSRANASGDPTEIPCPWPGCVDGPGPDGYYVEMTLDIQDLVSELNQNESLVTALQLPEDVFEAYRVLECVVPAEYVALPDAQKDLVKLVLSAGKVDLAVDSVARSVLQSVFGAETSTRANILALIG